MVTGEDTLGIPHGIIDVARYAPPGVGEREAFLYPNDKHPLARGKVRYVGDEVAAVAAVDEDTA